MVDLHKILLLLCLTTLPFSVQALEISTWSTQKDQIDPSAPWTLKGEIEKGDLAKLKAAIATTGVLPKSVMLDSPGGDINEAINIGLFLRDALVRYRSVED
nr:hypothetical protein [Gammaproteobacteria bacterium]